MNAVDRRAIALLAVAGFASTAAFRVCDPFLPQLAAAFDTTTGKAARVITAFALAYGVLQIFYGPLADRYGKYRVVATATLACAVGSLGCAAAGSLDELVFFRVIAGMTGGGIVPLSMAWIGDVVPYAERQATLARFLMGTILGMAGGQFLGGVFADTLGWRVAFVVLAACYVGVGLLLRAEIARHRAAGLYVPATPARERFVVKIARVLALRWARVVLAAAFVEGAAVFGALAFVPAHLHDRYGLSLTIAGTVVAVYGLGGLAYTALARRMIARLGEQGLARFGGALLCIAYLALPVAPSWPLAFAASFVAGLGFYMLHSTLQTNATQMAPASRGTAVSLFASSLFLGQAAGVAVGALIVDIAGARWLFSISAMPLPILGAAFASALTRRASTAA